MHTGWRGLVVGLLFLSSSGAWGQQPGSCQHTTPNGQGVAGADITVGAVATTVLGADTTLCGALITNKSKTSSIRCRQPGTDPTDTTGHILLPYQVLGQDREAQLGLVCIRDATAIEDVVVSVLEFRP